MATHLINARHLQDPNAANTTLKHYWGYPSRVLPCTKDTGTCEYLDAIYSMHETSMRYTFILWAALLGIAVVWLFIRGWRIDEHEKRSSGPFESAWRHLALAKRRWLSTDITSKPLQHLFGHVSRLQILILAILLAYLLLFSLIGITYRTWLTPIPASPHHNTRTTLGGFADRLGALAYALTPFTFLLAMRESVLSLVTGVPYQHFNFLHRWTGRVIFVQAVLHTVAWTVVEGRLYQPQPGVYREFVSQQYIVFGVVAMGVITLMLVLSTKTAIRWFGYEVFRIGHWGLAVVCLGACWGHWDKLWCWMVASLVLVVLDQVVRWVRVAYLHCGGGKRSNFGFHCAQAHVTTLGSTADDDLVLRLDFNHDHRSPWQAGQHFHLTFPSLSIWQSHPFTPSSLPDPNSTLQQHTYLLRVRKGITAGLATLDKSATLPVILSGPYGRAYPSYGAQNLLAVAGGTGVTFTLPIVLEALRRRVACGPQFAVEFVWVVKRARDLLWVREELAELRGIAEGCRGLGVRVFVTRETEGAYGVADGKTLGDVAEEKTTVSELVGLLNGARGCSVSFLGGRHPAIAEVVGSFVERAAMVGGNVEVVGSGPEAIGSDMRSAVAGLPVETDVSCYWDSRGD
ncbi:hypothetical protein LTR91_023600 [Friedmanniomyces endolithicus]|uniref:ferric-chelate reductase (NADPH) n=1 Tax=Friedmanniomyces endolithicus TaxID=329885 RepID=A0AAN6K3T8_9PEZI|nr:hypothetical protein LTR94_004597 [Friedmanniomyces endolithicus]KAK0789318.1 hypothetical protein LTR38_010970 [Friedmanniomyces endolithicus]KAK0800080.1 hypothetical protein LTR59_005877 [Friedmanniomyces endolithicus]KAK0842664.1 hypothetical protein LTR03_009144 [Friedmanniomyces endolithicus]KAK0867927.1 hypothetical protein LTS02_003900 [Friedmanniomyces endolithicus]